MTSRQWTALSVLGSGLLGVGVMALFALGRTKEAYAIGGSAALVSAILVAAHTLEPEVTLVQTSSQNPMSAPASNPIAAASKTISLPGTAAV